MKLTEPWTLLPDSVVVGDPQAQGSCTVTRSCWLTARRLLGSCHRHGLEELTLLPSSGSWASGQESLDPCPEDHRTQLGAGARPLAPPGRNGGTLRKGKVPHTSSGGSSRSSSTSQPPPSSCPFPRASSPKPSAASTNPSVRKTPAQKPPSQGPHLSQRKC